MRRARDERAKVLKKEKVSVGASVGSGGVDSNTNVAANANNYPINGSTMLPPRPTGNPNKKKKKKNNRR